MSSININLICVYHGSKTAHFVLFENKILSFEYTRNFVEFNPFFERCGEIMCKNGLYVTSPKDMTSIMIDGELFVKIDIYPYDQYISTEQADNFCQNTNKTLIVKDKVLMKFIFHDLNNAFNLTVADNRNYQLLTKSAIKNMLKKGTFYIDCDKNADLPTKDVLEKLEKTFDIF